MSPNLERCAGIRISDFNPLMRHSIGSIAQLNQELSNNKRTRQQRGVRVSSTRVLLHSPLPNNQSVPFGTTISPRFSLRILHRLIDSAFRTASCIA